MAWVLVTGATSGIGRACARRLAEAGHGVIACGRKPHALRALEAEASRDALCMVPLSLDVTDPAEVENAARSAEIITAGHGIDVLVNNAGYGQTGFLLELSGEQVRRQFDVNLFSVIEVTRAFLPQLQRNHGIVINIGSVISRLSAPWVGLYGTAKTALRVLTDVLRVELYGAGLRVVLVEPGAIRTPFYDTAIAEQAVGGPVSTGHESSAPLGALSLLYAHARTSLSHANYRPFRFLPPASPDRVAALIERIVRHKAARRRYVVPFGSATLLNFLRLVPGFLLDRFKRRAFYLA